MDDPKSKSDIHLKRLTAIDWLSYDGCAPTSAGFSNDGIYNYGYWYDPGKIVVVERFKNVQNVNEDLDKALVRKKIHIAAAAFRATRLEAESPLKTTEIVLATTPNGCLERYDLINNVFCSVPDVSGVVALACSPDGSLLVTGKNDGTIQAFEFQNAGHHLCLDVDINFPIKQLACDAGNRYIAICTDDGKFLVLDRNNQDQVTALITEHLPDDWRATSVACHHTLPGIVLAGGSNSPLAYLYDIHGEGYWHPYIEEDEEITQVGFLQTGEISLLGPTELSLYRLFTEQKTKSSEDGDAPEESLEVERLYKANLAARIGHNVPLAVGSCDNVLLIAKHPIDPSADLPDLDTTEEGDES